METTLSCAIYTNVNVNINIIWQNSIIFTLFFIGKFSVWSAYMLSSVFSVFLVTRPTAVTGYFLPFIGCPPTPEQTFMIGMYVCEKQFKKKLIFVFLLTENILCHVSLQTKMIIIWKQHNAYFSNPYVFLYI